MLTLKKPQYRLKSRSHAMVFAGLIVCLCLSPIVGQAQLISGRLELSLNQSDPFTTWQNEGTGLLRSNKDGAAVQQALLIANKPINPAWTAKAVINAYTDGDQKLGFSQAYLAYKPLSADKIRFKSRVGFFYPALSVENTAAGWLSPYTYTQSAINSWIGEEMRILGAEASLFSNGRRRNSAWSWEAHMGLFKGNDTFGTLLSWRGFALHDRQSLHHDRVNFAPIPSVSNPDTFNSPTWMEPFHEIDGKLGMYAGLHLAYLRKADFRYYFYDNRADPSALNRVRLYAWRTKFHSLAYQHQINPAWRVLAQYMTGATDMGPRMVYSDFRSNYAALNYQVSKHSVTVRYDHFWVGEDDLMPQDINTSKGHAWTIAWRYRFNKHIELGAEVHANHSKVGNRVSIGELARQSQKQNKVVLSYSF